MSWVWAHILMSGSALSVVGRSGLRGSPCWVHLLVTHQGEAGPKVSPNTQVTAATKPRKEPSRDTNKPIINHTRDVLICVLLHTIVPASYKTHAVTHAVSSWLGRQAKGLT